MSLVKQLGRTVTSLLLLATAAACDDFDSTDEPAEALGTAEQAVCNWNTTNPPLADASDSIVGTPNSVTDSGYAGSNECSRFALHVTAAPTADQAKYATVSSLRTFGDADGMATCAAEYGSVELWRRDCATLGGFRTCTEEWELSEYEWSVPSREAECHGVAPGPYFCDCGATGKLLVPGYSSKEDVRVAAKIVSGFADRLVEITVSEF